MSGWAQQPMSAMSVAKSLSDMLEDARRHRRFGTSLRSMEIRQVLLVCDYCRAESAEDAGEIQTREVPVVDGWLEVESCSPCWTKVTLPIAKRARLRKRRRTTPAAARRAR